MRVGMTGTEGGRETGVEGCLYLTEYVWQKGAGV